jgi:predicted alpha/beta-fold hydrolase
MLIYIKLFALSLFQDRFIFIPHPFGEQKIKNVTDYGFKNAQQDFLLTEDGEKIQYWLQRPEDIEKPIIVFFHGNAGHFGDLKSKMTKNNDRGYRLKLLDEIYKRKYGFMAVSLRGFGKSSGSPSEQGFDEDVKAVAKFIQDKKMKVIIVGESLGAYSALKLMQNLQNTKYSPQKVVLIAPFSNLKEKVLEIYPEFKRVKLEKYLKYKFNNKEIISNSEFKGKIMLLHPEFDNTTAPYHSEILLQAGKNKGLDITKIILKNCDHVTWSTSEVTDYITQGN